MNSFYDVVESYFSLQIQHTFIDQHFELIYSQKTSSIIGERFLGVDMQNKRIEDEN